MLTKKFNIGGALFGLGFSAMVGAVVGSIIPGVGAAFGAGVGLAACLGLQVVIVIAAVLLSLTFKKIFTEVRPQKTISPSEENSNYNKALKTMASGLDLKHSTSQISKNSSQKPVERTPQKREDNPMQSTMTDTENTPNGSLDGAQRNQGLYNVLVC